MTVPHPVLGHSPHMDDSGEHDDADIAYVAGYEWALSAYDDANRLTRETRIA
ncbi:MAG TPA: hypothetical protein VFD59_15495 [Nocardioidaceae bacterium]|nr:hypothetical protein [Nocardioidaceae bacterium]